FMPFVSVVLPSFQLSNSGFTFSMVKALSLEGPNMAGLAGMLSMSKVLSPELAVSVSPVTPAFQPSGKVMETTALSSGNFSVSARAGVVSETASRKQAVGVFMFEKWVTEMRANCNPASGCENCGALLGQGPELAAR